MVRIKQISLIDTVNNKMATIKQKKAAKAIMAGKVGSKADAMRVAGYAESVIDNPKKLTESDGWKELMEEYLPDDKLAKVHNEGLNAKKGKYIDYYARHKYLDLAYKVKGKINDNININNQTANIIINPAIQKLADEFDEKLKKTLYKNKK